MGSFKKYVTCIIAFFIPFISVTLRQFYSFSSPVLFTKNTKLWTERKEDFLYIWILRVILKEVENGICRHNRILDTCMYKQPVLTK